MNYKGIVAVDSDYGYAKNNSIPWNFSKDIEHFKKITKHSNVLMGRNTYAEIAAKRQYPEKNKVLLKDRLSIVLTSKNDLVISDDVIVIDNFEEIFKLQLKYDTTWFIGGEFIFYYGLNMCDEWYITEINKSYGCDKIFDYNRLKNNYIKRDVIYNDSDLSISRWEVK